MAEPQQVEIDHTTVVRVRLPRDRSFIYFRLDRTGWRVRVHAEVIQRRYHSSKRVEVMCFPVAPTSVQERDCSCGHDEHQHDQETVPSLCMVCGNGEGCDLFGCDCEVICSMGPTCPGAILAGMPGSGCHRSTRPEQSAQPTPPQPEGQS